MTNKYPVDYLLVSAKTRNRSYIVSLRLENLECIPIATRSDSNATTSKTRRIRSDNQTTISFPSHVYDI